MLSKIFFFYLLLNLSSYSALAKPFITNGIEVSESQFVSTFALFIQPGEHRFFRMFDSYQTCSGVAIGRRYLLTAAHCVLGFEKEKNKYNIWFAQQEHEIYMEDSWVERVHIHPNYRYPRPYFDLAVLELKEDLLNSVASIGHGVEEYDWVQMVGFGSSSTKRNDQSTIKRWGQNKVYLVDEHLIYLWGKKESSWRNNYQKSCIAQGDSGGPLFNRSGELIGIAAAEKTTTWKEFFLDGHFKNWGFTQKLLSGQKVCVFGNLNSQWARDFLKPFL
jgi:V8-like Glu-specific endopeptidase